LQDSNINLDRFSIGINELVLIVVIFSPYVFLSIRFDHLLIVLLSFLVLFRKIGKGALLSVGFLFLYYVIVFISTIVGLETGHLATNSQILDSFEWYMRGAILFLFFCSQRLVSANTLHNFIIIYIASSIIIGLIAVLQILFGDTINNVIGALYSPGHSGGVTFSSLMSNSRYSSILYQPVSYGLFFLYSISLVVLYSFYFKKHKRIRRLLILILLPLSILSVSKAIFLGIPLLMFFLLIRKRVDLLLLLLSILLIYLLILFPTFSFVFTSYDWTHVFNIANNPSQILSILNTAIESRYGDSGAVVGDMSIVSNNPLIGVGWIEFNARMVDSGYTPIMVRGGLIGLIFYLLYVLTIFYQGYKATCHDSKLMKFKNLYLFFILTSLVFAFGSPVLYIDRVADFYWMFSGLLIAVYRNNLRINGRPKVKYV
jgi:hypothetical protein